MLRYIAVLLLFVLGIPAGAHAQRIDGIEILSYGIMSADKQKLEKDANISSGQRVNYDEVKIIRRTSTITLHNNEDDLIFGAHMRLQGSPSDRAMTVRIVWLYPRPGLVNPATGIAKFKDEYNDTWRIGRTRNYFWTIGSAWTKVPGTWTLQIWHDKRLLAEQAFQLVNG